MNDSDLADRLTGALHGRYRVRGEIGRGGMATVLLAEDLRHGRQVALKVLHTDVTRELGTARFLREIQLTARLAHPHILPLLDSGEADGLLFYVMPLVAGDTLRARLTRERQLPVDAAVRITCEVASALSHAHGNGVLHRDVKPENILFADGHALLADFGIARPASLSISERYTATGVMLGTPAYMSPEQSVADVELDARSDLYSLASVTYEMLVGEPPFTGPTAQAILSRRLTETPRPIRTTRGAVRAEVEDVVVRALSQVPGDRQQSVEQFANELRAANVLTPTQRGGSRWVRGAAVAAIVLLTVAGLWRMLPLSSTERPAAPHRLAVLPLENLGGDEDAAFAEGMTDEIMSRLTEIGALQVVSRTSARRFRGTELSMRDVGAQLNADYVLEGTVRTDRTRGDLGTVRVTARLVRVENDQPIWNQPFDATLVPGELLRVQVDIASRVSAALNLRLGSSERLRVNRVTTSDSIAYRRYQLGRFQWQRRDQRSLERAAAYFREAVSRDSFFTDAYSGLSDALGALIVLYGDTPGRDRQRDAMTAARRAVALDTALAVAQASLGFGLFFHEWRWSEAEQSFRRAIALDPAYSPARYWFAQLLWARGLNEEALGQTQAAVSADPLSAVAYLARARTYRLLGRELEWVADLRRAIELQPAIPTSWLDLAAYHARRSAPDSARAAVERFFEYRLGVGLVHDSTDALLASTFAGRGDVTRLMRALPHADGVDWTGLETQLFAILGQSDSAFQRITRLEKMRSAELPLVLPFLSPYLARDPRWSELRARLGL